MYLERNPSVPNSLVHIDSGSEMNVPDIVMVEALPHQITGRIVWNAYPLNGLWRVSTGNTSVEARNLDGSFTICGLVPGEYTLRTDARNNCRRDAGDLAIRNADTDL